MQREERGLQRAAEATAELQRRNDGLEKLLSIYGIPASVQRLRPRPGQHETHGGHAADGPFIIRLRGRQRPDQRLVNPAGARSRRRMAAPAEASS